MNAKQIVRVLIVVLAALALTALVASAQGQPVPAKELPATVERGESASPAANLTESEPNNSFNNADPITVGDVISGKIRSTSDIDTFRFTVGDPGNWQLQELLFDIDAASQGSLLDALVCLYDNDLWQIGCNDDSDGLDSLLYMPLGGEGEDYYLQVSDSRENVGGVAYTYKLAVYQPLLVSAPVAGTVAGIAFRPEDILAHHDFTDGTEKWMLFFDGSDVGITQNVSSFALHGDLTLAFQRNQFLEDLDGVVRPNQFAFFIPATLGPATSGRFDGWVRPFGLAASEKLDAIGHSYPWDVSLSLAGAFDTTDAYGEALRVRDEDIARYSLEDELWEPLAFDGSAVPGLAAEDVIAADDLGGIYYLTIQGGGVIGGHPFNQKDIFAVDRETYHLIGPIPYFHGPDHGFNYNIDAFDVAD